MINSKEKESFLNSIKGLLKEVVSLGLTVEGSRNIYDGTAFEITLANREGIKETLKKLTDWGELSYEGFTLNSSKNVYKVTYCQKTPERLMRDRLFAHLVGLGFLIQESGETTAEGSGLLFRIKTDDQDLLKKLGTFETLLLDGYTSNEEGIYDVVYIFPKID